jgi:APA family basic amino acid/polyamine antiporter
MSSQDLNSPAPSTPTSLTRSVGLVDAILLGLGSILGTGVFVVLGLAAGISGTGVLLAVGLAALVATANALSAAQLAAAHPVSGGTYEYGYKFLTPALGFSAGWMFLCAKSASAATAALGLASYILIQLPAAWDPQRWTVPLAFATVVLVTLLVRAGIRRSARVNAVLVTITIGTLLVFCLAAAPTGLDRLASGNASVFAWSDGSDPDWWWHLFQATALIFVAFTGYGRITTLGEEVHDPAKTIPRAIVATLVVSAVLYAAVALSGLLAVGAEQWAAATLASQAPLASILRDTLSEPWLLAVGIVSFGAVTAMLGVLLNLILGLSRVVLAMGRRRDFPASTARLTSAGEPAIAVWLTGAAIAALTLLGSVKLTWSFSAFTVLVYYALTNLCALQLPADKRLFPRLISVLGLAACLSLAFFVELEVWLTGSAVLGGGLVWHAVRRWRSTTPS